MNCDDFRAGLAAYRAGGLEPDERRALEAHRAACADCERYARKSGRPPRLVALGFVGAFAASILTLIYTGLNVRDREPVESAEPAPPRAAPAPAEQGGARQRDEPERGDDDGRQSDGGPEPDAAAGRGAR